jgi:response regulator RpfG family c-di-GMP phosphodiesterase
MTPIEENILQEKLLLSFDTLVENSLECVSHIRRIGEYAEILEKYLNLDIQEISMIRKASELHDIGKIAIPRHILNKPTSLDAKELEIMKMHTVYGYNLLKKINLPLFDMAATIAYTHHERFDGQGYPQGLYGNEIPLIGRVVALVDVLDALRNKRVYKDAWDEEEVLKHIDRERGKHFDPVLVDILLEHIDEFKNGTQSNHKCYSSLTRS